MSVRFGAASSSRRKKNSYGSSRRSTQSKSRLTKGRAKRNRTMAKRKRELRMPSVAMPNLGGLFSRAAGFALAGVLLASLSVGLLAGYRWLTTVNYFALTDVKVQGGSRLSREHILKTAGLEIGANTLSLNIERIKDAVDRDPWVDTVSVKRILPGGVDIRFRERVPVFLVQYEGAPYYADGNGRLIDKVEPGKFVSLPQIEIEAGMEKHLDVLGRFRGMVLNKRTPFDLSQVAWIRLSWGRGLEVKLMDRDILLCIGPGDWMQNLFRLNLVWADLKKRRELDRVSLITAQDDKVWVEKRM